MNLSTKYQSLMGRKPWSGIGLIILTIHMLQVSCTETKTETKTVICTESIFLESADSGDTVALKQCLTSGIDIDLVNDSSLTALILAARQNRARCVKLLLDAGANSHYMNRRDIHAVGLAKGRGHQEVIDVIFRHQRSEWQSMTGRFDPDLFFQALRFNEYFIVEEFIKNGYDINEYDQEGLTPIVNAVFYTSNLVLETLLAHGADPNSSFDTRECLSIASMFGDSTAVSLLLKAGANVNATEGTLATALMFASEEGYSHVVDLLLKAGADTSLIDANQDTALKKAKRNGYDDVVSLINNAIQ